MNNLKHITNEDIIVYLQENQAYLKTLFQHLSVKTPITERMYEENLNTIKAEFDAKRVMKD